MRFPISPFAITAVRAIRTVKVRSRLRSRLKSRASGVVIGPGFFATRTAHLTIGDRVSIGPKFTLMADLVLGDDIMVSGNVSVIGNDHPFDDSTAPLTAFDARPLAQVIVEGDNLIGFNATLVGPLTVHGGAIVAAGAVVVTDVPANAVVAGVPAKVVRYRRPAPNSESGPR